LLSNGAVAVKRSTSGKAGTLRLPAALIGEYLVELSVPAGFFRTPWKDEAMGNYQIVVLLVFAIGRASATSLAPDSLVCESDAELLFVRQTQWLAGLGGARTVEQAKISAQLPELKRKYAAVVQTKAAQAEAEAAEAQNQPIVRVAQTCASSGTAPLPADILDVKAISGVTKVRIEFQGVKVQVWTATSSLIEK